MHTRTVAHFIIKKREEIKQSWKCGRSQQQAWRSTETDWRLSELRAQSDRKVRARVAKRPADWPPSQAKQLPLLSCLLRPTDLHLLSGGEGPPTLIGDLLIGHLQVGVGRGSRSPTCRMSETMIKTKTRTSSYGLWAVVPPSLYPLCAIDVDLKK